MNQNDMTDEELEVYEEQTRVIEDRLDRLELLRRELNSSHLEKMYAIKRSQTLGPACPYYKKAKRLWEEQQQLQLINKLHAILEEFKDILVESK
jgi:hypothetical protein